MSGPRLEHDHELDGALHEGCLMCELIVERRAGIRREVEADRTAERYRRLAERAPRRKPRLP